MKRDADVGDTTFSTITDVMRASVDELQIIRSIGPKRARQIKQSAKAWVSEWRDERFDDGERVTLVADGRGGYEDDAGNWVDRPDAFSLLQKRKDNFNVRKAIEGCIEESGWDPSDGDTVAWVGGGDACGDHFAHWFQHQQYFGDADIERRDELFQTEWRKYNAIKEGNRPMDEIPSFFDITLRSDIGGALAAKVRNLELAEWSDKVIICVDCDIYAQFIAYMCEQVDTDYEIIYQIYNDGFDGAPLGTTKYNPAPELTPFEPNFKDTVVRSWQGDDEPEEKTPEERREEREEKAMQEYDRQAEQQDGIPGNAPERADEFIDGAFAQVDEDSRLDDDDLTKADPGGTGKGQNEDKWA